MANGNLGIDVGGSAAQAGEAAAANSGRLRSALTEIMDNASFISNVGSLFVPIIGLFATGVHHANQLNKELTRLSMIYNKSHQEMAKYGEEFRDLSMELGIATDIIAQNAIQLAELGLSESEMMMKLSTATQFAKVANLDFASSANILISTVQSLGVSSEQASDVFTYLGDATAISAADIGQSMQLVTGATNEAGLQFEKVASWITTISSSTKGSSAEVGDSVNSMIERFQSLTETGFDENQSTNLVQVTDALNRANIDLVDTEGNFKNFGSVMDELGSKWGDLSNSTQQYISKLLAGESQSGSFLSLMQGYGQSVNLYQGSLNAAGVSQEKFNIYMESTEAKLSQLGTAWSGMWQSTLDSATINGVIDAFTMLINVLGKVVETVGVLPVVLGAVGFAGAALSKGFRTLALSVLSLGTGFSTLGISATAAKVALRGLAAASVVGLVFVAIGFALEKLIGLFFKAKDSQSEYVANLKETISTSQDNIAKITELNEQLKAQVGTQEELNGLRSEMAGLMPQIIDHYDAEGKAVYKTAQEIDALIEKEKELNLYRRRTVYEENSKKLVDSAKVIVSNRDKIGAKNEDFEVASVKYEALAFAEGELSKSGFKKNSKEYLELLDDLRIKVKKKFDDKELFAFDDILDFEMLNHGGITGATANAKNELDAIGNDIFKTNSSVEAGMKDFITLFQDYNGILVEETNQSDQNVKSFLDNLASSFIESAEISGKNVDEIQYQYEQMAGKFNSHIQANDIDLTKMINGGDKNGIIKIFKDIGEDSKVAEGAINRFSNSLSNIPNSPASASFTTYRAELSEFDKGTNKSLSSFNKLSSAYQTLQSGESLSLDTTLALIDEYPQFAKQLSDSNGLLEGKGTLLEKIANFERKERLNETERLLKSNKDLFDSLEGKRSMYEQFYTVMSGRLPPEIMKEIASKIYPDEEKEQLESLELERLRLEAQRDAYSKPIKFVGLQSNSPPPSSSVYEPKLNISKSQLEIDKYNRGLEENNKAIEEAKAKAEGYESLLKERLKLYSKLIAATGELNKEQQKEHSDLQSKLTKSGLVDNRGEVVEDVNKRLVAISKSNKSKFGYTAEQLEGFVQRYLELTNEIDAVNSQLKQVTMDIAATLQYALDQINGIADRNKTHYNNAISLLGEINTEDEKKLLAGYSEGIVQTLVKQRQDILKEIAVTRNKIRNSKSEQEKDASNIYLNNLLTGLSATNVEIVQSSEAEGKARAEAFIAGFDKSLEELKYSKSVLGDIDTEEEKRKAAEIDREINNTLIGGVEALNKEIFGLEQELTKKLTNEEKIKAQTRLEILQTYAKQYNIEQIEATDKWASSVKDTTKDAMSAIEEFYEKQGKAAQDALDKDLDDYRDYIDDRRKLFSRGNETEDFNSEKDKLVREQLDIQGKIAEISLDSSIEGQYKREQLEKELADKVEEIQKHELDRSRDIREQNFDDLLKNKEDEIKAAKEAADRKWQDDLAADQQYSALKQALLENNAVKMQEALQLFASNVQSYMDSIGSSIDRNLIEKLQDAQRFKNIANEIGGIYTPTPPGPSGSSANNGNSGNGSNDPSGNPTKSYYVPVNQKEINAITNMKRRSQEWKNAVDAATKATLEEQNAESGKSIGATLNRYTGQWMKNGMPLYHDGGEAGVSGTSSEKWWQKLLSSNEVPAILKKGEVVLDRPFNFINGLTNRMFGGISSVLPKIGSSQATSSSLHFEKMIHIDKVENKSDVDYLMTQLDQKFKRYGFSL
ncbi:phage tail tape measure protein [Cohnella herbarum]|uniref:Phage tail tape measure protein n=1 Tax=Cohnella herbarum TaxID=2728023 RepID=A0A7Z2VIT8_9BACL|nr:phage tail tape measure protein [Cohnella herbarum]QJD83998.1 phage tail tape measure protein [Cohnella herbarum]